MTTVTADKPEREEKPVSELERDAWVEVIDSEGEYLGEGRVLHVETYEEESLGRRALLVYQEIGTSPTSIYFPADMTLPVLTEAQVTAKLEEQRRIAVADQLRALADLIVERELPLPGPYQSAKVSFHFAGRAEEVDRAAAILGVERTTEFGTARAEWPPSRQGPLKVAWEAYAPKDNPKPEPDAVVEKNTEAGR